MLVGLLFSAMLLSVLWQRPSADAQVSEVTGSAYGFFTRVGLFGGPPGEVGPDPTVTLPPEGSATPITETDPDGARAQYGPAIIFDSTSLEVSTQGTTGPDGSATSSASAEGVNVPGDYYSADSVKSSCTASESGVSGSVTQAGALLTLSTDPETGEPVNQIPAPTDPAPNTEYEGTIDHVGDRFRLVLNEQIVEGDTITVNAVHLFLLGDIAVGEAVIGQSVCGVSATGSPGGEATTTTTGAGDSPGATTTTAAPGTGSSTATTAAPSRPAPTTPGQPRFTG